MVCLAGVEPATSAFAGLRSIQLSYKHIFLVVPRGRFELPRPFEHYALNVARLPFRHLGLGRVKNPDDILYQLHVCFSRFEAENKESGVYAPLSRLYIKCKA
jgi:hypothetical protein